jgi:hypothetical protein
MKVTVVTPPGNRVSINNQQRATIRTVGLGTGGGASLLTQLVDVDATDSDSGEVLVYDEAAGKYVIKTIPEIDGGLF